MKRAIITGHRLTVFVRIWGKVGLWCKKGKKRVKFNDLSQARTYAKQHGFKDGIHVKVG